MELEIKCMECGKRTRHFEIGPAAFTAGEGEKEVIVRDSIVCPKCKKDISNGKCVTGGGQFLISLIALAAGMLGEREGTFKVPPHLRNMALVSKENYEILRKQSKASIKLVEKLAVGVEKK